MSYRGQLGWMGADDISIPFGSSILHGDDILPSTGQTINTLQEMGLTRDDMLDILEQSAAAGYITPPGGGTVAGPFMISVGGKIYGANDVVFGTGQTVAQLVTKGYREADIATMIAAGEAANAGAASGGGLPPGPSPRISTTPQSGGSLNSIMNWFTDSSLISGVPNFALIAGGLFALSMFGSGKRRR